MTTPTASHDMTKRRPATGESVSADSKPKNPYEVRSLARGLRILENVAAAAEPQRLTDIAATLGVERATAFRYCSTLSKLGYLHAEPTTKAYSLGSQVRSLGFAAQLQWSWLAVVAKYLPVIAEHYGGAASFGVLEGDEILFLDRAVAEQALNQQISAGDRLPAAHTSIGKILLADLEDGAVRELFGRQLTRPGTAALLKELAEIRETGLSYNLGGTHPGLHSVAVAVRDVESGVVLGGLNVAGSGGDLPLERLRDEVGPDLLEAAKMIATNQAPHG
jgi:IclR family pca regulon transcriptional regulator